MVEVGLNFCCNDESISIDIRRWHQRQPAYVLSYPDTCPQAAGEKDLLKDKHPLFRRISFLQRGFSL